MTEKIVLTLSENYLKHWTVYDALRELYQNAFDRERECPEAAAISDMHNDGENVTLIIGNRKTVLDRKTLILGETSKEDRADSIGKFGEGYKLALLVLARNGIEVVIRTGEEAWEASLEENTTFGARMLTINVMEALVYEDLHFEIRGLKKSLYHSYTQYNLRLQGARIDRIHSGKCELLREKRNRGKVFVGDLYVCDYSGKSLYGYNFEPGVFNLGRDRNIINGFELNWESSRAIIRSNIEDAEMLQEIAGSMTEAEDTRHLDSFVESTSALTGVLWDNFRKEYPEEIPVTSEYEAKTIQAKYIGIRTVVMEDLVCNILKKSENYKKSLQSHEERPPRRKPIEIVSQFYEEHSEEMGHKLKQAYSEIILAEAIHWTAEDSYSGRRR